MNKQGVFRYRRIVRLALVLTVPAMMAAGCCLVRPRTNEGEAVVAQASAAEAIPILVTLVAEEGRALTAARERVLARLRSAMSTEAFAAVRTYEALPIVAFAATPKVIALLLTLPEVRHIEPDHELAIL